MSHDGTGAATVYKDEKVIEESNNLTFDEPYLLAMAANAEGKTGC